jgi:hypothetical protein
MKFANLIFAVLAAVSITACEKKSTEPAVQPQVQPPSAALPPGHPSIDSGSAMSPSGRTDVELTQKATVISIQDVPQFTYLEVKQGDQTRWLAASTVSVKKGDVIQFDSGSTMLNFNSKTLNRTFPSITFVNRVVVAKGD